MVPNPLEFPVQAGAAQKLVEKALFETFLRATGGQPLRPFQKQIIFQHLLARQRFCQQRSRSSAGTQQ